MAEDFLKQLRRVNDERATVWMEGQESNPLFWATEFGGEAGEVLNEVKKLVREEFGWRGSRTTVEKLGEEIADTLICLDAIARHYGIDIAEVVLRKFNATSDKVGLSHKLEISNDG
jgi:NTP pyrophosphatase (non-canonical NTP hydrolase)